MRFALGAVAGRSRAWLGLTEASRLLGIAPGTLRRWADDGRIPVFTTPGGHRRFARDAIAAMLPSTRASRPSLTRLGATPERMAKGVRGRRTRLPEGDRAWVSGLADGTRNAFRTRGAALVSLLIDHLDAGDRAAADAILDQAGTLAAAYGSELAEIGATSAEAAERFVAFRAPFLDELGALARRRGLDARETTTLLASAIAATDRLLVGMLVSHARQAAADLRGR